jgi:hypothetical protein
MPNSARSAEPDRINLSAYGATSTADFTVPQAGSNVLISGYDGVGNTITVKGIDADDLTDADFIFV